MPTLLLLRLNEIEDDERPSDALGNLAELAPEDTTPPVVDAVLGRGRLFGTDIAGGLGFTAVDVAGRDTLATRDMTVQFWAKLDLGAQDAAGVPGTVYARGVAGGVAQYWSGVVELDVVNAASRVVELRWRWMDIVGGQAGQIGGQFVLPDGFTMFTATRRWVSPTEVELRYYVGDKLVNEVISPDGSIGGGTTGTTTIGMLSVDGGATWDNQLRGTLDELRVLDEAITHEEVVQTWRRITLEQPRGYRLLRDLHDPGFPISLDEASRAQRETRQWGYGLGYAAAQIENIRENINPASAYGSVLQRWERMTKRPPFPGDSVETRRNRVCGKIRQRLGSSIPGLGQALEELLDSDPANWQILAFDQTIVDPLDGAAAPSLSPLRWRYDPASDLTPGNEWSLDTTLRVESSADLFTPASWYTTLLSIGGEGRAAAMIGKVTPATLDDQGEVGMLFIDRSSWTGFLFGLRRDGANVKVVTQAVRNGVLAAVTVHDDLGAGLAPVWLEMAAQENSIGGPTDIAFTVRWSPASADGPFDEATGVFAAGARKFQWAGFYARSATSSTPDIDAHFANTKIRAPYGERSFYFYVIRDVGIAGSPDFLGANAVLRGLRQSHTYAAAAGGTQAIYDDATTGYGMAPMGGF